MGFTATARIPTRPLSYSNSSMANKKELLVDWTNHKIYISDANGNIVEASGSSSGSSTSVTIDYSTNTLLTCSTNANIAAKTVLLKDYELKDGNVVYIKFANDNTAESPTLNINSTGAKSIKYRGTAVDSTYIKSNRIYQMFYTNDAYEIVGDMSEAAKDNTPTATTTTPGLLAPSDKEKIDSIPTGGLGEATTTSSGLLSSTDKMKIDNITDSSILSDTDRTKIDSIPTGGLSEATTTSSGLLSPTDKVKIDKITDSSILSDADRIKIDSIPIGGLTIDNAISNTSENPVQNKIIKAELDKYLPLTGGTITGGLTVNGKIVATANSDYTTYQVRNMALSTSASTPTGNGSLLGVYS